MSKPQQPTNPTLSASSTPRSPAGRGPRIRGKVPAQSTKLEPVDDSVGPLGPLGENSNISEPEQPPAPPSKEQSLPIRNARQAPTHSPMSRSMLDSNDLTDDDRSSIASRQKFPQQGHPSTGYENARRQNQPSVSIEQAARPSFDITVGDPHKVGDLTSSHIVYQVRTKVRRRMTPSLSSSNSSSPDIIKSIQATRVLRLPPLPRLPLAVRDPPW